ncbi:AAA family ATPase [Actinocrispum wychmicini]|uniref:Transcriptional activator n=1 Tax=Actinocrispum wychmicini TaxID=1213861 RepID=A0A4R2J349_9PSEU|nr:AAA family ATPase [Actinocrispum wychmicini]TCO52823.1 transcriptional activator [Actinocrispum wychmicini]
MLIRLTGLVTIERDGAAPRHLSSAQTQVAFARLVMERTGGTSRDHLADTVWPEGLPDTWASALRSVVSRVRGFIAGDDINASPPIIAQGGRYLLRLPVGAVVDVEQAETDVAQATEAFTAGEFADAERLAAAAVAVLERPFMPDHDGEWPNSVREKLGELLVSALETASLAASALNDERNSLRFADEAVRRAPLRESAHRCRMTAHVAAGNRAEALRSYHELRRMLAEELGIDPAPETQAAYAELLGSPVVAPSRPRMTKSRSNGGSAAPFVGRRQELARLSATWAQVEDGACHMVLVTGEPGIGKTRLVTEAARRISVSGGVVMYGRSDSGSTVPCQPFVEALGGYVAATPTDSMPDLSQATQETLTGLLAAEHLDELGSSKRAELLLALTELLVKVARDQPVFVVLDDLDLADDDTLVMLRQVYRRRFGTSLMIAATAGAPGRRPDAPDHFAAAIHDVDREGWLRRIPVTGLAEADVRALIRRVLPETSAGQAPPPHQLIADTAGNTFLLLELLRWHGDPDPARPPMPSGIVEYASARLSALDSAPRQLLRTAAAAGPTFELDIAAQAAELSTADAVEALDALVCESLVAETDGEFTHEFRFVHDVVRRAIYQQASAARRRWLHTRLADAIELRRAGELARYSRTMAHHRDAGAVPHGDQRAVRWGWRAAARASQDGAPNEAVHLHRQALEHVPAADVELRAEALTNLGLAQLAAGHTDCEQTLLDGAIQALHNGRLTMAAQAALGLADVVLSRPRMRSEAVALIEILLKSGPAAVDTVTVGRLLARQSQLGGSVVAGEQSTAALTAMTRELQLLEGPQDVKRRMNLAAEMQAVAAAVGDKYFQIVATHHRAMAAEISGDVILAGNAMVDLNTAIDIAIDAGEGDHVGAALRIDHTVAIAVTEGRFSDAAAVTQRVHRVPDDTDHRIAPVPGSMAARQMIVANWLRRSSWPDSPSTYEAAERSLISLVGGDRGLPHLTVRALATGVEPLPSGDEWPHIVGLLALGGVELGDPATAEALRTLLEPYADLNCCVGYRSFVGPASFHLGRLAVIVGDWDDAERHLTAALAGLAHRQARPWTALAQLALAQALEARGRAGDRRRAETLRAEANWTLASLDLQPQSA